MRYDRRIALIEQYWTPSAAAWPGDLLPAVKWSYNAATTSLPTVRSGASVKSGVSRPGTHARSLGTDAHGPWGPSAASERPWVASRPFKSA